ncbi:hypothetical protein BCIN_01g06820 [Botrytis cinerea B05.10]|uniref:Rhodopsin domain-containing protein n=3 Tax=Botryotinia fuckeliana TaxID=40559 RepID=A0A384J659_BOTFB|nr:hypothetical protein BCIN_01g06820 [Botrytis cinerea B05.10]ATZ46002.1 hypothetical protein BCIN_01g06820 [Botrytis cinerea B05.10]EMR82414.1 hypothetical protein BcDW1_8907 [Botrytis cinerea BcDW1]CCD45688.1 hypothetical protein BofuT4_P047060.1 [Botrytis cinerea T4]
MAPLIFPRGDVSPSNSELLHNTIGFVIPSFILFGFRILNATWVMAKMRFEDWLMCVTMCFYTVLLILINVSARYETNLFPPDQLASIMADPDDVASRIYGSIIVIPLEQCMLASTWCVKICIWLFLWRLCRNLPNLQMALKILMGYIAVGYVVIMFVYYVGVCRPFKQYWAVPVQDEQCATYQHYSIVQMVFNISSDFGLILIPLWMFYIARLPPMRKAILMGVFSLAVFTILAAILNKYYNFSSPMTTTYQLWYIRESSVAIWVGNLICCWQIVQKIFKARSFDNQKAEIDMHPEMIARMQNPSNYTENGSPKPKDWMDQLIARRKALGEFLSVATRSRFTTRATGRSGAPLNSSSEQTALANSRGDPVSMMTMEKGDEDAILPTLAYRENEKID